MPQPPSTPSVLRRYGIRLAILWAACTFLAAYYSAVSYADYASREYQIAWSELFVRALADWWPWVLLGPGLLFMGERFHFERGKWMVALAANIPAGVGFAFGKSILAVLALKVVVDTDQMGTGDFFRAILQYWVFIGAVQGLEYQRRYRERGLRASQLEAQLVQSQLQALKMQMHPHFLFNTLHAISTLMHRNVDAAERMITRLSDLLRLALETEGVQEVSLRRELELLERYLEIEQIRFGDRLEVAIDVEDTLLDALVPNLILQPLVENAVRHGVAQQTGAGRITVAATRTGDTVRLEVSDNGPGLPENGPDNGQPEPTRGVGLSNTIARLEQLYGDRQQLEIRNGDGGGVRVRLSIPFVHEDAGGNGASRP